MTEQLVAIAVIIFVPLAAAAIAHRLLPSTRFDVAGRLGGFGIDAAGALAVYVVLMGVALHI